MAYRKVHPSQHSRPRKPEVYFILQRGTNLLKIGKSIDVPKRLDHLQIGSPFDLSLMGTLPDPSGYLEDEFHERFVPYRERGEWFRMEGDLLKFIKDNFAAKSNGPGWVFVTDENPVMTLGNAMACFDVKAGA